MQQIDKSWQVCILRGIDMKENLLFQAGPEALEIIRDKGLSAEDIDIIPGAAGGPKWLVLSRIDRALFGEFLKDRKRPLFLIGSSIGSWRFAAATQKNFHKAIDAFEDAYINQRFLTKPSAQEITDVSIGVLDAFINEQGTRDALNHPYLRINMFADLGKGLMRSSTKGALMLGLGLSAFLNLFSRKGMGRFFSRTLFYDGRDLPPFFDLKDFPTTKVALTPQNIKQALLGSGSIPAVMQSSDNISGAPEGKYWDGGMIDYHIDIPFNSKGLVLYPHFFTEIIPGWFDKYVPWHNQTKKYLSKHVLVSPSPEFIASLPMKKVPDRRDFYHFAKRDDERVACWRDVVERCRVLEDEFLESVYSGSIKRKVRGF